MSVVTAASVPDDIASALRTASKRTGTGFEFLMQTAMRESGLNAAANASTSSAVGLFQFIEGTWMETLKETGAKHGLDEIAAAIRKTPSGGYEIADPDTKAAILALRTDPGASALMAGELAHANAGKLYARLGRRPTGGELYIAHFLGAGGAGQLISAAMNSPGDNASQQFPAAARANPSIFYNRGGKAKTVGQVYANLIARHSTTGLAGEGIVAGEGAKGRPHDITPDRAKAGLASLAGVPSVAMTKTIAQTGLAAAAYAGENRPLYSLFQTPATGQSGKTDQANPAALMATLKAYGMKPTANAPAVAGPPNPARSDTSQLWGGGLFTNAPVRPMAADGGLFSTSVSRPR